MKIKEGISLSSLTSFHLGGPARFVAECGDVTELKEALLFARTKGVPYVLLGRGSNVLASDRGFDGLVILLKSEFEKIEVEPSSSRLQVGAGVGLIPLAQFALTHNLTGMEQLSGIPGSVGGALYMNAGAYEKSIGDLVESVTILDPVTGEVKTLSKEDMAFGYRVSRLQFSGEIALQVSLCLEKGDGEAIRALMHDLSERRRAKQPLEYPSAGSVFKRPVGNFAGALIEQSGLKGLQVGGAKVSEKHAGFIVNVGPTTTTADVKTLMDRVVEEVQKQKGVTLEPELRFLGTEGFTDYVLFS